MGNKRSSKDDGYAPGQGIDTDRDEGFQTRNIDKNAERAMYGNIDLTAKQPSRKT